jgi:hypothetical protein
LDPYTEFDELKQSLFDPKTQFTEIKEAYADMKITGPQVASLPFKEQLTAWQKRDSRDHQSIQTPGRNDSRTFRILCRLFDRLGYSVEERGEFATLKHNDMTTEKLKRLQDCVQAMKAE